MWYFYMIECVGWCHWNLGQKVVYTGETRRDPEIRFDEHVKGVHSQWMRFNGWRPRRLLYVECMPDCDSKELALAREQQLKRDTRFKRELRARMAE